MLPLVQGDAVAGHEIAALARDMKNGAAADHEMQRAPFRDVCVIEQGSGLHLGPQNLKPVALV
ncbi:MAG: hypothetical protein EPO20_22900 [Betaproteobacteria bacterium]|nr:MAG: hypothetical protein EPO20_22900 [Betaproteobacteria bacterium]